jgi:hypothetical protein
VVVSVGGVNTAEAEAVVASTDADPGVDVSVDAGAGVVGVGAGAGADEGRYPSISGEYDEKCDEKEEITPIIPPSPSSSSSHPPKVLATLWAEANGYGEVVRSRLLSQTGLWIQVGSALGALGAFLVVVLFGALNDPVSR